MAESPSIPPVVAGFQVRTHYVRSRNALYARVDLPDEIAYKICGAFKARHDEMTWEEGTHEGLAHLGIETDATPMDVPMHPGAQRWWREQG